MKERARHIHDVEKRAVFVGSLCAGVTEMHFRMRGYEHGYMDMALDPALARGIQEERLRLATARSGESLTKLCQRADCAEQTVPPTAVMNRVSATDRMSGGELVKIIRAEAWTPAAQ